MRTETSFSAGAEKVAYNIAQAVEASGISRARLYIAFREGELRAFKHGRRTLILRDDLLDFLRSLPPLTLSPRAA